MEDKTPVEGFTSPPIENMNPTSDATALLRQPIPVVTPLIPEGSPPLININHQLQGDYNTGPVTKAPVTNNRSNKSFVEALVQKAKTTDWAKDPYQYTRSSAYGAGYKNMNFERYYSHNKFAELGFSPYRDNETYYNEKGSWWDDQMRAGWQTLNLMGTGFKSALPGSGLWGDEQSWNEDMEKAMSIGMSSRGGAGGWITNFGLNTGYTIGIAGEMFAEDLALAAITGATFGTTAEVTAPTAFARTAMGLSKIERAWGNTAKALKALQNIDKARDVWNLTKNGVTGIAKFVNPLSETTDLFKVMRKGGDGWDKMSNLAKVSKSLGAFYHDARQLNLAYSESILEGQGAKTRYHEEEMDRFYAEKGRMPTDEEALQIYKNSENVKFNTEMSNFALIHMTNKLVFDELLDRSKPFKKMQKAMVEGDIRQFLPTKASDFRASMANRFTMAEAAASKWTLKGTAKKVMSSSLNPLSMKYFASNIGEALQELGQESISNGMIAYQNRVTSDPSQKSFYNWMGGLMEGMGSQFSWEGLNTLAQGYLTGGVLGMGQKAFSTAKEKYQDWRSGDPETREQRRQQSIQERNNQILNAANSAIANILKFDFGRADRASETKIAVEESARAAKEGDVKGEKDFSMQAMMSHFHTLASSNSMGLVTQHVKDMLALDDKTFAEAYEIEESEAQSAKKKLEDFSKRGERYQKQYKLAKESFPNPFKPWSIDRQKDKEAYDDAVLNYQAHEESLRALLFSVNASTDVAERMTKIAETLSGKTGFFSRLFTGFRSGRPFSEVNGTDISALLDPLERKNMKQMMVDQIAVLKNGTADQKKQAERLEKKMEILTRWDEAADVHLKNVRSVNKASWSKEEEARRKEYLSYRKGAVVKDKNTGEEWTVEKTNPDGTATLKNSKGEEKVVSREKASKTYDVSKPSSVPEQFADLGDDVSDTLNYMYEVFREYMGFLAKDNDVQLMDRRLDEAFEMIRDFYMMDNERRGLAHTVNLLSDSQYFQKYFDMQREVLKEKERQRVANLERVLEKVAARENKNHLINRLIEIGVVVDEEDLAHVDENDLRGQEIQKGVYRGVLFYDVASKERVPFGSEKFKEILKIIEAFEKAHSVVVKNKPFEGKGYAGERLGVGKFQRDDRTLEQLAEQFGFDASKDVSEVPVVDLLKALLNSKMITGPEVALTRRLLTVFPVDTKVRFDKDQETMVAYDEKTGTVSLNPRFAASDYFIQKPTAIEYIILNGLIRKIVSDGFANDPKFEEKIDAIRVKVLDYLDKNPNLAKIFGADMSKHSALTDNLAFAVEAMSNYQFQDVLFQVQVEEVKPGKQGSSWEAFMEALLEMLGKVMNIPMNSTALGAVGDVIGTHLEAAKILEKKPDTSASQVSSAPVMDVDTMEPALLDQLVEYYRNFFKDNPDAVPSSDASREEIIASERFKDMLESNSKMNAMVKNYKSAGASPAPAPSPVIIPVKARFQEGTEIAFAGTVLTSSGMEVELENHPMLVVDEGEISPDGNSWKVKLKSLMTSEEIVIDLKGPYAHTYKEMPLVKEPAPVAEPVTKTEEEIKAEELGQEIDSFENRTSLETVVPDSSVRMSRQKMGPVAVEILENGDVIIRVNNKGMVKAYEEGQWSFPMEIGGELTPFIPKHLLPSLEAWTEFVIKVEKIKLLEGKKKGESQAQFITRAVETALSQMGIDLASEVNDTVFNTANEFFNEYRQISDKESLDAWYDRSVNTRTLTDIAILDGRDGASVMLSSDVLDKLREDKIRELATKVEFQMLVPGKVVYMRDGSIKKVSEKKGNTITLVDTETNTSEVSKLKPLKLDSKNFNDPKTGIMYIHNEFIDTVLPASGPLTEEQREASQEVVKDSQEDGVDVTEIYDELKDITEEEVTNDFLNALKNCKL